MHGFNILVFCVKIKGTPRPSQAINSGLSRLQSEEKTVL